MKKKTQPVYYRYGDKVFVRRDCVMSALVAAVDGMWQYEFTEFGRNSIPYLLVPDAVAWLAKEIAAETNAKARADYQTALDAIQTRMKQAEVTA